MLWLTAFCAVALSCATGAPLGGRANDAFALMRMNPAAFPRAAAIRPERENASAIVGSRDAALETARSLVGQKRIVVDGRLFADDCTGLVLAAYSHAGASLTAEAVAGDNGVTALYRFAQKHGRVYFGGWPVAGDLVFFRDTYDQNRDGRADDGLTHVGIVDAVDADGTITVIHRVRRGVVRYRMNLSHRSAPSDPATGKRWNDILRRADGTHAQALTAQLFAAYATLLPVSVAAR